jgi:hypothetical protein
MILTTAELARELEVITYKPGWRFRLYDGAWEGQHFVITTAVPDAYHEGRTTTLDVHSMLPPMETFAQFRRWIGWRLARIEVHEMREFLQRRGAPIFDPHAENAEHDLT